MQTTDFSRIAAALRATVIQVRAELAALGEDGASFHPADGEWCAKEVVGHLVEADRRGFSGRVGQILAGEPISAWDQPAVAAARNDCAKPWTEVLAEFDAERRAGLDVLESLTEDDLSRSATHPMVGDLAIGEIVHEWPFHDRDHLRQILENTRVWFWPRLGAAQQFAASEGWSPVSSRE